MKVGVHLPLFDLGVCGHALSGSQLAPILAAIERYGISDIAASDHIAFTVPWLDGFAALSYAAARLPGRTFVTAACLPTARGAAATAKALAAVSRLSGAPVMAGVAPGSSRVDLRIGGVPEEQKWARFEDALHFLRASLSEAPQAYRGPYYAIDEPLRPGPHRGSQLWVASWGSRKGVDRAIRLGDGLLLSAYNAGTSDIADVVDYARAALASGGSCRFRFGCSTCFFHVTDTRERAREMVEDVLVPFLGLAPDVVRQRVMVGSIEQCAARLKEYADTGLDYLYVLPVGDTDEQFSALAQLLAEHAVQPVGAS